MPPFAHVAPPGEDAVALALDRAYLARFTMGNADLEREVLNLFAGQAPSYLDTLSAAATPRDWKNAAHTLKGSAAAVGALQVAHLAALAERLDAFGPGVADLQARDQTIAALRAAVSTACSTIAALEFEDIRSA